MVRLLLSAEERDALLEVLESTLSDLSVEIGDTDNFEFRAQLKARAKVLHHLLAELQQPDPAGPLARE